MSPFPKTDTYIKSINIDQADVLDRVVSKLLADDDVYERASQALRRRFSRGADIVDGYDRNNRPTRIKRVKVGGKYNYYVEGQDGTWNQPDERVWIVAMYALWQINKHSK